MDSGVLPAHNPALAAPCSLLASDRPLDSGLTREARLKRLVSEHFRFVWRSLRRVGLTAADADDAAQEVFLIAARRVDDIALEAERSFLFTTALRVASTRRRSLRRRREDARASFDDETTTDLDPEQISSLRQARVLLDGILEQMDADARVVFVLFEMERLSGPAIAELLQIPVGTVSTRLRRAREIFRSAAARVAEQGGGPTRRR
jgi:RNA polymerase sigma-70 factor (ECF subfamily)